MDEQTKQFLIKVIVAGVVVYALYMLMSPLQQCKRNLLAIDRYSDNEDRVVQICLSETTW